MPAEWEAWLRYRRDSPPTPEEVFRNMQLAENRKKLGDEASRRLSTKGPSKSDSLYERYPRYKDYEVSPQGHMERVKDAIQDVDARDRGDRGKRSS